MSNTENFYRTKNTPFFVDVTLQFNEFFVGKFEKTRYDVPTMSSLYESTNFQTKKISKECSLIWLETNTHAFKNAI